MCGDASAGIVLVFYLSFGILVGVGKGGLEESVRGDEHTCRRDGGDDSHALPAVFYRPCSLVAL